MKENNYDKKLQRWTSVTVIILALSSAVLSYDSLRTLATQAGVNPSLAFLFPIVIDGLILSGSLLILFYAERGIRTHLGVFLTGLGVVASIAGNVAVSPGDITSRLVHAAPPLVLFLSLEALTSIIRQRSKENKRKNPEEAAAKALAEQTPPASSNLVPQTSVEPTPEKTASAKSPEAPGVAQTPATPATPAVEHAVKPEIKPAPAPRSQRIAPATNNTKPKAARAGKTVRDIVREKLEANPAADIDEILQSLSGDRKYNRKIIKEELAKLP